MSPQASFYVNGAQKYSANIGDTLVFDIPGYQNIWLTQYQNGILQYDGPESLPTAPLVLTDPPDVGTFQGTAFEVNNGQKGAQITSWTFQINAAPSTNSTTNTSNTTGNTCTTGMCTTNTTTNTTNTTSTTSTTGTTTGGTTSTGGTDGGACQGGAGLSPFGGLPGDNTSSSCASTTGATGTSTTGTNGTGATGGTTTQAFNLSGFVSNPIFWLLVVLLLLVWFMSE